MDKNFKHNVKFWTSLNENCYCEKNSLKGEISVCISGGGLRAAVSACGWIKGLNEIGVIPRYISTVSGSSWFNLPYYYNKNRHNNFLGRYYPSTQCSIENVTSFMKIKDELDIPFESVVLNSDILSNIIFFQDWNKVIANQFFKPYNLHDKKLTGPIMEEINNYGNSYPIINSNIVILSECRKFYPIEFTPLYHRCVVEDYFIDIKSFNSNTIMTNKSIEIPESNISISDQASFSSEVITAVLGTFNLPKISTNIIYGIRNIFISNNNEQNFYTRLNPITNQIINTKYLK